MSIASTTTLCACAGGDRRSPRFRPWPTRNPPISCCATGSPPIPPIPTSPPTSRACADIAPADIADRDQILQDRLQLRAARCTSSAAPMPPTGRLPEAIAAWRKAADKGSTSAMVELGVLYGTGAGVAKDEDQARKLFERAAEAGNPRGVTNLAALSGGGGAPSDPARARELLAKAAETNAEAQYQLGLMMADGTGGPQDDAGARACSRRPRRKIIPARWSAWARSRKRAAAARRTPPPPKPITSAPRHSATKTPRRPEAHRMPLCDQGQARESGDQSLFLVLCHAREGGHPVRRGLSIWHGCLRLLDHPVAGDDDVPWNHHATFAIISARSTRRRPVR